MDAFGYNALSGFFGSAGIKNAKMQELQYLEKIYNLRKMKQQEEDQLAEDSQKLIDTAYNAAVELTTGENARRKDILDIEGISTELLQPINDKIQNAGSYEKAKRLGIDKDLREYQYKLMNNDKVYQMKLNQNAIAKIIEADASGKGHLINQQDRAAFNAWQAEKADKVTFRGVYDSDINMDFINSPDYAGKPITKQDIIVNNMGLINDWAYSVSGGDPVEEQKAHALATANPNIINSGGWLDNKLQILSGVRDSEGKLLYDPNIKFGKGEIKTSLTKELLKGQLQMFPEDGLKLSQIIENGGFQNFFKRANVSSFFETTFGIDENNPGLMEKDSYIFDSAGRLASNDPALEQRLVLAGLDNGPNVEQDYYFDSNGDIMLKINNLNIKKMYDYKGASLDGDAATFMDRDADDMKFKGIFLGMKVTYHDEAGNIKSKLLMKGVKDIDPTDSAENINKTILGEAYDPRYTNLEYRPAYVMQFEEPDVFGFEGRLGPLLGSGRRTSYSDAYYREINLGSNNTLAALNDAEYDKQLSDAKNERFNAQRYQTENRRKNEMSKKTRSQLDDIYASGLDIGIKELTDNHEPSIIYTSRAMGFDRRIDPYLMADVFDMAQMQGGENFSQNVSQILNGFHKLEEEYPDLLRIYKSGDPKALIDHYKSTLSESQFKQKLNRFKLWSKYFNRAN